MLVHVSGLHSRVRASSPSGCAFVYFTVYFVEDSSTEFLLQAQKVLKQVKAAVV